MSSQDDQDAPPRSDRDAQSTIERASNALFDDTDLFRAPPFEPDSPKDGDNESAELESGPDKPQGSPPPAVDFLSQPLSSLANTGPVQIDNRARREHSSPEPESVVAPDPAEPFSLEGSDPDQDPVVVTSSGQQPEAEPPMPGQQVEETPQPVAPSEVPSDAHRRSQLVVDEDEEAGSSNARVLDTPEAQAPAPVASSASSKIVSLSECLVDPALIQVDEHRQPIASPLLQDYRRIKRPLLLNVRNNLATGRSTQGANIILVTSARPSEGKSTVAMNLAISIATELDYYALLVDADVHSATVSRTMQVRDRLGLSDLLTRDEVSLQDTIVHTEWQNLSILPSGPEVNNIDELFASQSMYDFCSEVWQRYEDRIIVVDSAPILVGGEPQILARMVGQIVMVVEADNTPQHVVIDALGQLPDPDKVGFVLNKASRNIGNTDYGYYRSVT